MKKIEISKAHQKKQSTDFDTDMDTMREPIKHDKSIEACFGPHKGIPDTIGVAKDRIVFLTMQLARKDIQLVEAQRERDYYVEAFNEAKFQNKKIVEELQKYHIGTFSQFEDSCQILQQLKSEMKFQKKMLKDVCRQLVESLSYFNDINHIITEYDYD